MNSKRILHPALLLAVTLIGWASFAPAQPPSGSFRYELGVDAGVPLYNFSGAYSAPFLSSNAMIVLYQNAKGALSGSEGPFPVEEPNVEITGAVAGSVRNARANLAVRLRGDVWIGLRPIGADYLDETGLLRRDAMSLVMAFGAGAMSGTDKTTVTMERITYTPAFGGFRRHVTKLGTTSFERDISLAVPPENDGSWVLDLNMVPNVNKLSGTASITFPNSKQFHFSLVGSYLPKTGKTKVLLRGRGEDRGAYLALTLGAADLHLESMRGKVGGQRVKVP